LQNNLNRFLVQAKLLSLAIYAIINKAKTEINAQPVFLSLKRYEFHKTYCLVAFATSVDYDIQFVGGFKNALFGGEGIVLARLAGPGKVYLQSLPFSRLADRVLAAAKFRQVDQKTGVAGVGGDILGGLLGGDRNF
jgi:hypothetical protein